jgi:hypothetical protein
MSPPNGRERVDGGRRKTGDSERYGMRFPPPKRERNLVHQLALAWSGRISDTPRADERRRDRTEDSVCKIAGEQQGLSITAVSHNERTVAIEAVNEPAYISAIPWSVDHAASKD